MARLAHVKRKWVAAGRPLTAIGSRGQEQAHHLWTMLEDTEKLAQSLRADLRKRHSGPAPSAQPGAGGLGPSPAAAIRAVK